MEMEFHNVRTSQELSECFFKEFHFTYVNSEPQTDLQAHQKVHFND